MTAFMFFKEGIYHIQGTDTTVYGRKKNIEYKLQFVNGEISSPINEVNIIGTYQKDNTFEYTVSGNKLHNGLTVVYKGKIDPIKLQIVGTYSWYFFTGSCVHKMKLETEEMKQIDKFINNQTLEDGNYCKIYSQLINMGFNDKCALKSALQYPTDINKAINTAIQYVDFVDIDHKIIDEKQIEHAHTEQSVQQQFYKFLQRIGMQKYFNKFKENELCDMESIELFAEFTDEDIKNDDTLREQIGIQSVMLRKKFVRQCKKIKVDMNKFKNDYGISSVLHENLAKYGIVTINILCNEVVHKIDLKNKFNIGNNNQCDQLWCIINREINAIDNDGARVQEDVYNDEGVQNNLNETAYI
eukprot:354631_1